MAITQKLWMAKATTTRRGYKKPRSWDDDVDPFINPVNPKQEKNKTKRRSSGWTDSGIKNRDQQLLVPTSRVTLPRTHEQSAHSWGVSTNITKPEARWSITASGPAVRRHGGISPGLFGILLHARNFPLGHFSYYLCGAQPWECFYIISKGGKYPQFYLLFFIAEASLWCYISLLLLLCIFNFVYPQEDLPFLEFHNMSHTHAHTLGFFSLISPWHLANFMFKTGWNVCLLFLQLCVFHKNSAPTFLHFSTGDNTTKKPSLQSLKQK